MFNFNYYTPTKVVFGKDTELQVADLIKEYGITDVLLLEMSDRVIYDYYGDSLKGIR